MSFELIPTDPGIEVALHTFGGSGPPLVIAHATGFHARAYEPIAARLTARFRVVGIDLRGHGDSRSVPPVDVSWWGMARDVLAAADHIGDGEPVLAAGHSMGGAAIVMAELTRPGSIAAAWLFEPIVIPHGSDVGSGDLAAAARRRRAVFADRDEIRDRYLGRALFRRFHPEAFAAYVDHGVRSLPEGTVTLKCLPETEARTFESSYRTDLSDLSAVTPAITVVGSGDGLGPAVVAPQVASALPRGEFESWADLTHFGPFEDPDRAARSIAAHLSGS